MRVEALLSFGFRLGRSLTCLAELALVVGCDLIWKCTLDLGEHLLDAIKHVWMSILCHEIEKTILEYAFVHGGCNEGYGRHHDEVGVLMYDGLAACFHGACEIRDTFFDVMPGLAFAQIFLEKSLCQSPPELRW